ncbi:MAG: D-tyrosyl-tRNA(Tyr) deacylase [Candidatus Latescibacteria bacterium]|nr:D-tyrosyl-tRNA(Tyr) deacylase [Candidatus Latescibacterota bacterium]
MRALLQRVTRASVRVDGATVASIGPGLLILLGVRAEDPPGVEARLAERCAELRIFEDERGKMNRSVREIEGEALVVPQFTLYADVTRGRRPGFDPAAKPDQAERAFESFCEQLAATGVPTRRGRFGASMDVELVNRGPATFLLELPTD